MKTVKITGTVSYQSIETGFWAIIGDDGENWRPVPFPDQLKYEGKKVTVSAVVQEDSFSMIMWGTPITIIGFEN